MSTTQNRTLIILNPKAGGGRAGRLWSEIEPMLWDELGELVVAVTQHPEEVGEHLDKARDAGLTRVVAIGGDGTNHAIVNAIQRLKEQDPSAPEMTFAQLPMGSGQDFSRTLGIPFDPAAAVQWIAHAEPKQLDIGQVNLDNEQDYYFLNIASAGISSLVAANVNNVKKRRPWTYRLAAIKAFFAYQSKPIKVYLDGELWYDDRSMVVAVANGKMFGHGMNIAPDAEIDDGLFDVLALEAINPISAIFALNSTYSGKHVNRKDVYHKKASDVVIESLDGPLGLELDGEPQQGERFHFQVKRGALKMLVG